jgi:hypothetical protein
MLPLHRQISVLVHLSNADKEFAEAERNFIYDVGKRNGLSIEEIDKIIENPEGIGDLKSLPPDEKFNYMLEVVQLMKVDNRVRQSEITFCEIMAMKLGYRAGIVPELSQHVYSNAKTMTNLSELRRIADQYLIKPA